VLAVHGNADEPAVCELLPAELVVDAGALRIGMTHNGGPRVSREARLVARFPRCGIVVYGHSHVPQVERHDGVWILNPGSPTERRQQPDCTMIVASVSRARFVPKLLHFPA
jgi:uncharacterized protein